MHSFFFILFILKDTRICKTYSRVQCNYSKDENENESHDNKEHVDPTVMSRWCEPVEKKSREGKRCHVTNKWNNKQSHIPK